MEETLTNLPLDRKQPNPRYTLDLLIQEHEQIRSKTRARGRRGPKGDTRRHGALGEEDKSRSPNAVDDTRIPSVEGLQVTRSPPYLSLERFGWVEGLRGGRA
jgi:hypothetical protein